MDKLIEFAISEFWVLLLILTFITRRKYLLVGALLLMWKIGRTGSVLYYLAMILALGINLMEYDINERQDPDYQ